MKQLFELAVVVTDEHIDFLKHVNNEIYLRWLIDAADAHSTYCGYPVEKYLADGACFVVRRHEIDYLAPAFLGERLIIETWVEEMQTKKSRRAYRIRCEHDGRLILSAETVWVFVNLSSGRPVAIPADIIAAFNNYRSPVSIN